MNCDEAEEKARKIVNNWVAGAAAVSWVPGSTLVLGVADFAMIRAVAKAFGVQEFNMEAVVATIGAGAVGKVAVEGLSFIPIFGWALKAAIAAGVTKGVGEATIKYFKDRSPYCD